MLAIRLWYPVRSMQLSMICHWMLLRADCSPALSLGVNAGIVRISNQQLQATDCQFQWNENLQISYTVQLERHGEGTVSSLGISNGETILLREREAPALSSEEPVFVEPAQATSSMSDANMVSTSMQVICSNLFLSTRTNLHCPRPRLRSVLETKDLPACETRQATLPTSIEACSIPRKLCARHSGNALVKGTVSSKYGQTWLCRRMRMKRWLGHLQHRWKTSLPQAVHSTWVCPLQTAIPSRAMGASRPAQVLAPSQMLGHMPMCSLENGLTSKLWQVRIVPLQTGAGDMLLPWSHSATDTGIAASHRHRSFAHHGRHAML